MSCNHLLKFHISFLIKYLNYRICLSHWCQFNKCLFISCYNILQNNLYYFYLLNHYCTQSLSLYLVSDTDTSRLQTRMPTTVEHSPCLLYHSYHIPLCFKLYKNLSGRWTQSASIQTSWKKNTIVFNASLIFKTGRVKVEEFSKCKLVRDAKAEAGVEARLIYIFFFNYFMISDLVLRYWYKKRQKKTLQLAGLYSIISTKYCSNRSSNFLMHILVTTYCSIWKRSYLCEWLTLFVYLKLFSCSIVCAKLESKLQFYILFNKC